VCSELILHFDFSVICGHRSNDQQDRLYAQGRTEAGPIVTYKRGGQSIHNTSPSRAVDLAPYRGGVVWDDEGLFHEMAGALLYIAASKGIDLKWGWHLWQFDMPHFQVDSRG
jgi:peptidoglycan L-alanyl-D-glutamate endopeptidase CwlK